MDSSGEVINGEERLVKKKLGEYVFIELSLKLNRFLLMYAIL